MLNKVWNVPPYINTGVYLLNNHQVTYSEGTSQVDYKIPLEDTSQVGQ